jgi:hypothetical protein
MTLEEFAFRPEFSDVKITDRQFACARFLEQNGKRFLIDFGYENCERLAGLLMSKLADGGKPQ